MMRILEVISGLPRATGTTAFFLESGRAMCRLGAHVDVLLTDTCGHDVEHANVYHSIAEYERGLASAGLPLPSVVHIHALWEPFLASAHRWARRHGIPVVVSPHGALSPWAMASKRWKKMLYWHLVERSQLKHAAAFHVTAENEGQWVRERGFMQPQILAPLGVEIPASIEGEKVVDGKRLIVSVGRIYRVKGLDRIVRAVKLLKDAGKWQGWRLVLAGPDWMDYRPELEKLIAECGLGDDVCLPGSVFGEEKDRLYRQASIYIVASHTENFCQPVAEALSYGVPAIASKGCPWDGLESHECGRWVDNSPRSLADALEGLMSKSDDERHTMGMRGRQWMREDFSWDSVGKKLLEGFEGVGGRG